MSNKLFTILDGIIESDYTADILNSEDDITAYADAVSSSITGEEAERIQAVGKKWLDEQENGNGEWSRMRYEAIEALRE